MEQEKWYEVEYAYAGSDDWFRSGSGIDTRGEAARAARKIKNEVFDARVIEVIYSKTVVEVL